MHLNWKRYVVKIRGDIVKIRNRNMGSVRDHNILSLLVHNFKQLFDLSNLLLQLFQVSSISSQFIDQKCTIGMLIDFLSHSKHFSMK